LINKNRSFVEIFTKNQSFGQKFKIWYIRNILLNGGRTHIWAKSRRTPGEHVLRSLYYFLFDMYEIWMAVELIPIILSASFLCRFLKIKFKNKFVIIFHTCFNYNSVIKSIWRNYDRAHARWIQLGAPEKGRRLWPKYTV